MPALKEKAVSLLGSIVSTGMGAGSFTIFTVPVGKVARLSHVTVFNPTASLATVTAIHFGTFMNNSGVTNIGSVTAATHYINIFATGQGAEASAGQVFQATVVSGAGAASASLNAWGFLADS